jgi:DNA polymerase elongation subunit (family B)
MIGRVVWVDYKESTQYGPVARVGIRMKDGSKKNCYITDVEPWGFVHEDADIPERNWIKRIEHGYESLFDETLKKIVTTKPSKVNSSNDNDTMADYVDEHYESDIPMYRKLSIIDGISGYVRLPDEPQDTNNGIEIYGYESIDLDPDFDEAIEPRVMLADIEVRIGDESFDRTRELASQPINVICAYDNYDDEYSVFYYDKYDSLSNPAEVREIVESQIETEDGYENTSINLSVSPTEASMANSFINYVREKEFDLTSGWNWTDFDYEYIINRFSDLDGVSKSRLSPFGDVGWTNNKRMRIRGLPSFDMMRGFCDKMTFSNWRSKSLDYVSNEELGVGKVDDVDINEDWQNYPERLIGYNIVDVILTVMLDDANDVHNFFYEMGDVCSIPIYDTFFEKRLVDGYIMSRRKDDEILPSADESELVENAGGYVADAIDGTKDNLGVSDLKSLYPSAIITWNISTETVAESPEDFDEYVKIPKVPEPKDVDGDILQSSIDYDWLYASLDREGLIPRTTKKLFKKRNREKEKMYDADDPQEERKWDRKQGATKVVMNSIYGNVSSKYYRLSNEYLGDAVTSTARYTLWKGEQTINRLGYEHIYSDTDSHVIQLTEDTVEERVNELKAVSAEMDSDASEILSDCGYDKKHPFLVNSDLHGDEYTCMMWEAEKVYDTFIQLGKKKRYAGNIAWKEGTYYSDPNVSISGFEFRRSDSPEVTADLQKKVIEMILLSANFKDVSAFVQSIIDDIDEEHPDVKKFALPGSINKDLEDYPNRQVPRASMYSNEHLGYEFGEGDSPFVYMVKDTPPGLPQTDVVAFEWNEDIPEGFKFDKEAIIERAIRKPIAPIINEVDWKFSELREGKKAQELDINNDTSNPFQ